MVTNITRVFDKMSWIMISVMTFLGFLFLLLVVPVSQAYGARVHWNFDFVLPAGVRPEQVSIETGKMSKVG